MGKGDRRTKRGKINVGSYGNVRKKTKTSAPTTAAAKGTKKVAKAPAKKKAK